MRVAKSQWAQNWWHREAMLKRRLSLDFQNFWMLARTRPLITERFKSPHFSHLQANKKLLLIGEKTALKSELTILSLSIATRPILPVTTAVIAIVRSTRCLSHAKQCLGPQNARVRSIAGEHWGRYRMPNKRAFAPLSPAPCILSRGRWVRYESITLT